MSDGMGMLRPVFSRLTVQPVPTFHISGTPVHELDPFLFLYSGRGGSNTFAQPGSSDVVTVMPETVPCGHRKWAAACGTGCEGLAQGDGGRSPGALQGFVSVFSWVRNLFVPTRSKHSATSTRLAALAHWNAMTDQVSYRL